MGLACLFEYLGYGKCAKILYANVFDKMAYENNADPDQTVHSGLHCLPFLQVSVEYGI